jgi:hypothetical protein
VKGNHFIPGVKVSSLRTAKPDKGFAHSIGAIPDMKEETHQSNTGMRKRKQKILPFKVRIDETSIHINLLLVLFIGDNLLFYLVLA